MCKKLETVTFFFSKLLKLSFWSSGYLTDSAQCTRRRSLTVEDHVHLLSTQFLAKTLDPEHPSHDVSTAPQAPHPLRHTLTSKYCGSVSPLTTGDISPPGQCGDVIKSLHTSAVESSIRKLDAKGLRMRSGMRTRTHRMREILQNADKDANASAGI